MAIIGSFPLEDLADVVLAMPVAEGQTLVYDATASVWRNRRVSGGSGGGVTPIITATATVDDSTGSPAVTVTKSGTDEDPRFAFAFTGLKGEQGIRGIQGERGEQGERGATGATGATPTIRLTATVDNTSGTPAVTVTKAGNELEPVFALAFTGLKGADGTGGGTTPSYVLPAASAVTLGGVKVGQGLVVADDGTLSVTGGGGGGSVTVDSALNSSSSNPVANSVITNALGVLEGQVSANQTAITTTNDALAQLEIDVNGAFSTLSSDLQSKADASDITALIDRIAALEAQLSGYVPTQIAATDGTTTVNKVVLGKTPSP